MIRLTCIKCHNELKESGGLLFEPPHIAEDGTEWIAVGKFHLCRDCWTLLSKWLLR